MNLIMLIIQKLKKMPSWLFTLSAFFSLLVVALFTHLTGQNIFILYLIPVSLATILAPRWSGISISIFSVALYIGFAFYGSVGDPSLIKLGSNSLILFWVGFLGLRLRELSHLRQMFSFNDELTGGLSNSLFFKRAEEELHRSHRYKRPVTLAYLDCSTLKTVRRNQNFKYENEILRSIAQIMKDNLRKTDLFTRVDEDNFLILLPEINGGGARTALKKIQSLIRLKSIASNWPLEFNIGAITFVEPPLDMQAVLKSVSSMAHSKTDDGNFLQHQQIYH